MRVANGSVSPEQQTKVYLGNKLSSNHAVLNGGSYKKKKYSQNGGCGCGSKKSPKQMKKMG